MAEYIEREKVLKFIQDGLNHPDRTSAKAFGHDGVEIMAEVYHMPAADVAPVVHGSWIEKNVYWLVCSVCKMSDGRPHGMRPYYCPKCGAKMDLPPLRPTGLEGGEDNG